MPWARKSTPPIARASRVEHIDEGGADGLALLFGVGDPGELVEEQRAGVAVDQRDVVMLAAEQAHDGIVNLTNSARLLAPLVLSSGQANRHA